MNESINFRGYTIEIEYDQDAACPWSDWDGCTPLIAYTDDGLKAYGDITLFPPQLTEEECSEVIRDQSTLTNLTGFSTLQQLREDLTRDYYPSILDAVNQAIQDNYDSMNRSDKLELLADVWTHKGVPAICVARHGYCQGDWAELLLVQTPEFTKLVGAPTDDEHARKSMEADADLWAAWAYGDVFGYMVFAKDGEDVGSCWGFYGSDHEKSGLMEMAISDIEWHIAKRKQERIAKIKELIRNHVPLYKRPSILEAI